MPLNAYGWTTEEDEILAELVRPHSILYNSVNDPSRKTILARELAWGQIAQSFVNKPPEECKKRWRGIRDSYMRSKRVGSVHRSKVGIFEKLEEFLSGLEMEPGTEEIATIDLNEELTPEPEISLVEADEQITDAVDEGVQLQDCADAQDYVDIQSDIVTLIESPIVNETRSRNVIKILPKPSDMTQMGAVRLQQTLDKKTPKIIKGRRRKRNMPPPTNTVPVKILPNPINPIIFRPIQYQEQQNTAGTSENRSQLIDTIIEKILKESTNEVDVFFKSMAEAVKKMHPSIVPKVKMEVCNVVAKYEMQSIYKKS